MGWAVWAGPHRPGCVGRAAWAGPRGPAKPSGPRGPSGPGGELLPCSTAISVPRPLSSFVAMRCRFFLRLSCASRIELSCSTSSALIFPSPDSMLSFVQPQSSLLPTMRPSRTATATKTSDATAQTATTAPNASPSVLRRLGRGRPPAPGTRRNRSGTAGPRTRTPACSIGQDAVHIHTSRWATACAVGLRRTSRKPRHHASAVLVLVWRPAKSQGKAGHFSLQKRPTKA